LALIKAAVISVCLHASACLDVWQTASVDCKERTELSAAVQRALADLAALIHQESEAIKTEAPSTNDAIDKLIEEAFGRKERAIGAFYQHRGEHGC